MADRRPRSFRRQLLWVAVLVALAAAGAPIVGLAADAPITFSAIGDVPYGDAEVPVFQDHINKHNVYSPSDLFVHVGDIKAGAESCAEFRYSRVADMMHMLTVPAYIVPGDNETTDCADPAQGWQYWTQYFMAFESAFCGSPLTARQVGRQENFAFVKNGVLFVGVNLVGGVNDPLIMSDDAAWVEQQFQANQANVRAAVVIAQAGPGELGRIFENQAIFFDPFVQSAAAFAKPILYIHGDGHAWIQNRPFSGAQNVLRVQVERGTAPPVQFTVTMDAIDPFQLNRDPWPAGTPPFNRPPCVNAGPDQTIALGTAAALTGEATDNWVPNNPPALTYAWSQVSGPGTVNFSAPTSLTTTASFSAAGSYGLRLTVNDGALLSSDDLVVSTSLASDDAYQVIRNQTLAIPAPGVLGNDSAPPGGTLTASLVTEPTHGAVALTSDGAFTYTPAVDFVGTDGFTYAASDGLGDTDVASVALTVIGPPVVTFFAPVAGAVGVEVAVHGGGLATAQAVAFNGTSAVFTVDADNLLRATVPAGASTGPISVTNPAGMTASAAVFTVQSSTTFERRIAAGSDDAEESATGSMSLISTDIELVNDGTNQTVGLRFTNVAIPAGASISRAYIQFQADEAQSEATNLTIQGQAADNPGTFTTGGGNISSRAHTSADALWSPPAWTVVGEAGLNQRTPELKAVVQEVVSRGGWASGNALAFIITGTGHRTAEAYDGMPTGAALLHVEYSTGVPPDAAPVVSVPPTASAAEGTPLTVNVTASDPDGGAIASLTASGLPTGATFTAGAGNTSGTLEWTPTFIQAGSYTVTFTAANALSGSASTVITVSNVDLAPVAAAPASASAAEGTPLTVDVTASDPDGDAIASLTASGLPTGATFTAGAGNTSGTLDWTPTFDQSGSYTVTFTAANALSGSASTVITVSNVDRAPVAGAPATASAVEGTPLTVDVTASDPDGDAIATLTASGLPTGATFTAGAGNTSGTLDWTPTLGQAGSYTVTFTAANALSGSASTEITVTNDDLAPVVAAPATATVAESQALSVEVTASDPDGDPIVSLTASDLPTGATFTAGAGNTSGTLTWTPTIDQSGSYTVTFTAANALSGAASTVITVSNVDRAPVAGAPATASAVEGTPLSIDVTASDPDGDAIASLTASGLPTGATFTAGAGNTSGTLDWTPTFSQAESYTVTFTAANALSGSTSTLIVVSNVDRAPVVVAPATAAVAENQALAVNAAASDPDGDTIGSLTVSGLPPGATFTVGAGNTSGTLSWTPTIDQSGSYTVTFTAANGTGTGNSGREPKRTPSRDPMVMAATSVQSGSASTVITVSNVDRAPVANAPATASAAEGTPFTVDVTASDPDGDAIASLTASGLPTGATFTAGAGNTSGTLNWTPTFDQAGSYTVTFTAANALSGSASTVITASNVDRPPVASAPAAASAMEGTPLSVNVTASDPDVETISSLTATGLPTGATFTVGAGNTSGTLNWTPTFDQAGSYTVTFTAANALSGSASTVITVQNFSQPPVASLVVTPSTGDAPLAVTADASGSSDPDGTIATYRFDFGDGTIVGPQTTPTAAHTYGAGNWTASVTVTDNEGSSHTTSQPIIAAAVPPEPNLVGNPSFEVNTTGWAGVAGATLSRVAGGFDGGFALRAESPPGNGTIEVNDMPNWVDATLAVGVTYRFTAWVKAAIGAGSARLRVREYVGTRPSGGPKQSNDVTLSATWQLVALDFITKDAGSTLDFQIVYNPVGPGEAFLTDNIGIRQVVGVAPATVSTPAEEPLVAGAEPSATDEGPMGLVPSLVRTQSILSFRMETAGSFEVDLLDLTGRRVRQLVRAYAPEGTQRLTVDGRGDQGERLPPGVYFYRVQMPGRVQTGEFVIIR